MTREEASFILANIDRRVCDDELNEALDMAIKALEQEPTDRIEYGTDGNAYKLWISNGKEYEPSGDLISRQAVKDWFCTNYCSEHNKCEHFEKGDCNAMIELFAISSVNPQEPKFIAKSDGTIEQIKNCDDCLFKKEWEKIGKLISVVLE